MTAALMNPDDNHRPSNTLGEEMLTLQEACAFLRIPEGTLRYWRHLGSGPHSFKVGRHVRYWRTDLVLWLTELTNASPSTSAPHSQATSLDERRSGRPQGR